MDKLTPTTPEESREGATARKVNLTDADFDEINNRLMKVVLSQLAIKNLAIQAIDDDSELSQHWLFAIEELANQNVRGIDACFKRMGGELYVQDRSEFES